MEVKDTIIGCVIDRSGSMFSVIDGTVEGFNKFLTEQNEVDATHNGKAFLSLTLFDDGFDVRYVAKPIEEVPLMTSTPGPNQYTIGGNTALFDAVGVTIKGIEEWHKRHEFKGRTLIMILTDGQENSSRTWHIRNPRVQEDDKDLLNLIEYKQKEGWEFVFLGAGGSSWLERTFGPVVPQGQFVGYVNDSVSNVGTYSMMSSSVTNTRSTGASFSPVQSGAGGGGVADPASASGTWNTAGGTAGNSGMIITGTVTTNLGGGNTYTTDLNSAMSNLYASNSTPPINFIPTPPPDEAGVTAKGDPPKGPKTPGKAKKPLPRK